jgi:hypothetical protein
MTDLNRAPPPGGSAAADPLAGTFDEARKQAQDTADAIDQAFSRVGESIAKSLAKAAADGKLSFGELAAAAIQAADSLASSNGGGDILGALTQGLQSLFSGARADGGPVGAGGDYLGGERGPEVFRPSTAGEIAPLSGAGGTVVNVTVQGGGAPAVLRSEAQIAAALARAVSLGSR